jgi:hypothetical protein
LFATIIDHLFACTIAIDSARHAYRARTSATTRRATMAPFLRIFDHHWRSYHVIHQHYHHHHSQHSHTDTDNDTKGDNNEKRSDADIGVWQSWLLGHRYMLGDDITASLHHFNHCHHLITTATPPPASSLTTTRVNGMDETPDGTATAVSSSSPTSNGTVSSNGNSTPASAVPVPVPVLVRVHEYPRSHVVMTLSCCGKDNGGVITMGHINDIRERLQAMTNHTKGQGNGVTASKERLTRRARGRRRTRLTR